MTLSISAKKADGTFSYEVHNGAMLIEAGNGYPSQESAETAARVCYHALHDANFVWTAPFFQNDHMSIDDIFAEMEGSL
jgi:hypothetical protein